MRTGQRLVLGAAVIAAVTGYLAYLGAQTSWQYYLTVDECLESAPELRDARMRVHGRILPQTLRFDDHRQRAWFALEGTTGRLQVECQGPLPDNLTDNMEVVVEGRLSGVQALAGDRVMTQCASKYQSGGSGAQTRLAQNPAREGSLP